MNFLISVIVPLYKGLRYIPHIREMVEKNVFILKERYKWCQVELIFVNDYPDENVGDDLCSDYVDTKYINLTQNMGIHGARVEGLKISSGKYILFLDQDDDIMDEWMYSQLEHIMDAPAVVCDGKYRNGRKIYGMSSIHNASVSRKNIKTFKIISPGQVLIRRDSIPKIWEDKILKFNGSDDFYLWLLILSEGHFFNCNYQSLFIHNENGDNQSFKWDNMIAGKKEVLEALKCFDKMDPYIIKEMEKHIELTEEKYRPYIFFDKLVNENTIVDVREKVILYGMGVYGNKLLKLLQKSNVEVVCGIDKDAKNIDMKDLLIYSPNDKFPYADLMIVTPEFVFDEVKNKYNNFTRIIKMSDFLKRYVVR